MKQNYYNGCMFYALLFSLQCLNSFIKKNPNNNSTAVSPTKALKWHFPILAYLYMREKLISEITFIRCLLSESSSLFLKMCANPTMWDSSRSYQRLKAQHTIFSKPQLKRKPEGASVSSNCDVSAQSCKASVWCWTETKRCSEKATPHLLQY